MPKKSCKTRTTAAIKMAVPMLAFTTLISNVKTNQDTMSAAIRMIKSTGMDVALKGIHQAGEF